MLDSLSPGTIVDERYQIIELLGSGGMGTVYKARELGLGRLVALKFLQFTLIGDKEHRERFYREGQLLSALSHPNILVFYRFGTWNLGTLKGVPYISMEFLKGTPLSALIKANQLTPERSLAIGVQICQGLEYAHAASIIHRDLKPANIIITNDPEVDTVKIVDFGLARLLPTENDLSQHLTQTGALLGSVFYMSPEQCMGKKADIRSDIYSLGCLFYEAITGSPPLVAENPVGIIHLHVHEVPPPVPSSDLLPVGINAALQRALAKNPEVRYQTASEFERDLHLIRNGRGKEISEPCRTKNRGKPKRFRIAALVCALVIACLGCAKYVQSTHFSNSVAVDSTRIRSLPEDYTNVIGGLGDHNQRVKSLKTWLLQNPSANIHAKSTAHFWLYTELKDIVGLALWELDLAPIPVPESWNYGEWNRHPASNTQVLREQFAMADAGLARILSNADFKSRASQRLFSEAVRMRVFLLSHGAARHLQVGAIEEVLKTSSNKLTPHTTRMLGIRLMQLYYLAGEYQKALNADSCDADEHDSEYELRCLGRQNKEKECIEKLTNEMTLLTKATIPFCRPGFGCDAHRIAGLFLNRGKTVEARKVCNNVCKHLVEGLAPSYSTAPDCSGECMFPEEHALVMANCLRIEGRHQEANDLLMKSIKNCQDYNKTWPLISTVVLNSAEGHSQPLQKEKLLEAMRNAENNEQKLIGYCTVAETCADLNEDFAYRIATEFISCFDCTKLNSDIMMDLCWRIGAVLNKTRHYRESTAFLQEQLKLVDSAQRIELSYMRLELARGLAGLGKVAQADEILDMACQLAVTPRQSILSDEPQVLLFCERGILRTKIGKPGESKPFFEEALLRAGKTIDLDVENKVMLLEEYARTCKMLGDNEQASALTKRAEDLLPLKFRRTISYERLRYGKRMPLVDFAKARCRDGDVVMRTVP